MRRTLALVSAAVTSMVALAFLIPLAVIVRDVARDRAFTPRSWQARPSSRCSRSPPDRATLERAIASTQAGEAVSLPSTWPARSRPTGCAAEPWSAARSTPATPTCARP